MLKYIHQNLITIFKHLVYSLQLDGFIMHVTPLWYGKCTHLSCDYSQPYVVLGTLATASSNPRETIRVQRKRGRVIKMHHHHIDWEEHKV